MSHCKACDTYMETTPKRVIVIGKESYTVEEDLCKRCRDAIHVSEYMTHTEEGWVSTLLNPSGRTKPKKVPY